MKTRLLLIVNLLFFPSAFAQQVITQSVVQDYVSTELRRISTQLVVAGLHSEIPVYYNDSLNSTLTINDLSLRALDTTYAPSYEADTITLAASIRYKTETSAALEFGFSRQANFDQSTVSNELTFVAPLVPLIASGIDLGLHAIGLYKLNDVEQVLDRHDFEFLKSLGMQTLVRGNLQTPAVQFYGEPDSTDAPYIVWRSFSKEATRTRYDAAFAGAYVHQLLAGFLTFKHNADVVFYQDKAGSLPYVNLTAELSARDTVSVLHGDRIVSQPILIEPDFAQPFDFKVHHAANDRILEVLYSNAYVQRSIFFSWNDVAEYFQPYDRAVLKHMISVL